LTSLGESLLLPSTINSTNNNYLKTRYISIQGTHYISSSNIDIVVSIGDSTMFRKIIKMTNTLKTSLTPLKREVINFIIIICSVTSNVIGIVNGEHLIEWVRAGL
jgi:sodium/potassium-transporting ATPase subunit alpha